MFTPGPWRAGRDGAVIADNRAGLVPAQAYERAYFGGEIVCRDTSAPNQALVRCAPDMYEFLDEIRQSLDSNHKNRNRSQIEIDYERLTRLLRRADGYGE